MGKILLTFDIEEFDLPLEYGLDFSEKKQFEFSLIGLKKILKLLEGLDIKATFFVTASFALKYPEIIKKISRKHEIASHGLKHDSWFYDEKEVKDSKKILEKIIGKRIRGFRMPRFKKVDYNSLNKLNFLYDSSITPTYLPGRYNYSKESRKVTKKQGIFELPLSTTPLIKIPFFWIFFRFFGMKYSKIATSLCTNNPGFVNIYFHPWEFNDLSGFKIPFYIKRNSGKKALQLLQEYLKWCKKKNHSFVTSSEFLRDSFQR